MNATTGSRELGRRVRAARAYAGLSMEGIAQEEVTPATDRSTWRHYELGEIPPQKRQWLIEETARATDLPREFFEVDFDALAIALVDLINSGPSNEQD